MLKSKKLVSAVLAVVMLASATSCSLGKQNPEDIVKAAGSFAKAAAAMDPKKISKNVDDMDEDDLEELKEKFDSIKASDTDGSLVKQAIADTITYEVDEDSVEIKKDKATCDVVFTMVDYADTTGDLAGREYEFVDVITSTKKTKDYEVTLELVKKDDKWLVTADSVGELDDLYAFIDHKFDILSNIVSRVDTTEWMLADNGVYMNTYCVELDLWFNSDPGMKVYYEVYVDGAKVYTADPFDVKGLYVSAIFDDTKGAKLTGTYISAGSYNIKIYAENGELLADETCTVQVSDTLTPPETRSTFEGEGEFFIISDTYFADIKNISWWDYGYEDDDGVWHRYMPDLDVYCKDAETIAFSVELNANGPALYYAYYFLPGESPTLDDLDVANPVYSDTISPTLYPDGTIFYDFDYTPEEELEVGVYVLVVSKDAQTINNPYITALCKIADITSDQIA